MSMISGAAKPAWGEVPCAFVELPKTTTGACGVLISLFVHLFRFCSSFNSLSTRSPFFRCMEMTFRLDEISCH
jgi:hypothetical protein